MITSAQGKASGSRLRQSGMRFWRMAAIYRCCIRFGKDHAWALDKVREIFPDGARDSVVDNWFVDMGVLQARYRSRQDDRGLDLFLLLAA